MIDLRFPVLVFRGIPCLGILCLFFHHFGVKSSFLSSFVVLPLALGVPAPSAQPTWASYVSHLLVLPQFKTGPSLWMAGPLVSKSLRLATIRTQNEYEY